MDISPQKITLDINRDNHFQALFVKQGDRNSRYIEITLTADDFKLELANIASNAIFSASNKGKLVQNDVFKIDKNKHTVLVTLSENALVESGTLECELSAVKDEDKVTSASFFVVVSASAKGKCNSIIDLFEGIVTTKLLAKGAVTGEKIAPDAVDSSHIADGSVGSTELADGAINRIGLFSLEFLTKYLSMPMSEISVAGVIQDNTYNNTIDTGVYKVGSSAGEREMLVVYKLSNAQVVQVRYTTEKIYFRGIHAEKDGEFPAEEWSEWQDLTARWMGTADTFKLVAALGENVNPEIIAYQTEDPTTPSMLRIPLSLVKEEKDFVDAGNFDSLEDLISYHFKLNKVYRIELTNDIGETLPKGIYVGRYYVNGSEFLELASFVPDGYVWKVCLDTGTCEKISVLVEDTDPNCHADYFDITDDGELALKSEYAVDGELYAALPTDLIIPEIVDEMAVDRLASGMFMNNEKIESLTFPNTVDVIPDDFCNMAVNLKEIKNTEHIKSVGANAFLACSCEKVVMPNLEEVGTMAFCRNPYLIYADIGKIPAIVDNLFRNNLALTKVRSGGNITSVGEGAFATTPRLTNVDFIQNLTSIGKYGFLRSGLDYDWSSLNNCTFGTKATYLQVNPTDFWSTIEPVPCENPIPTVFAQKDKRWENQSWSKTDPTNRLYGANGCNLFCTLHAYCGVNNLKLSSVFEYAEIINSIDPDFLNTYRGTYTEIAALLNTIGVTATKYDANSWNAERLTDLYNTLANGGYAIVSIQTSGAHSVCVYGVNEKKELLYIDSSKFYWGDDSKAALGKLPFYQLVDSSTQFVLVSN